MGFFTDLNVKIDQGLEIEKNDQKLACIFFQNLVQDHPSCKACRFHMGRICVASQNQNPKINENKP
jgi:hypothetical protein